MASPMLIDAAEKFILKSICDMDAGKLYENYLGLTDNGNTCLCAKSVVYLKAFVQHPPTECIGIIRLNGGQAFALQTWGYEYIHLLTMIAAFYLDRGEKHTGLIWALKAVMLTGYLLPALEKKRKEQLLSGLTATSMLNSFPTESAEIANVVFMLKWEYGIMSGDMGKRHSNDNG